MRKRNSGRLVEDTLPERKFFKTVAQADMFPKPKEEFRREQTPSGALVSLISASLIAILVIWEIVAYGIGRDAYHTELSVDRGVSAQVSVNFDITFPHLKCHDIVIDTMDATGAQDNNILHDLFKSPVDSDGQLVFTGKYNYVERRLDQSGRSISSTYNEKNDPLSPKFCGNCYIEPSRYHSYDRPGGVLDEHLHSIHKDVCCNTCESVMQMYDLHRIPRPSASEVEQCITDLAFTNPGCNVRGTLNVKKVVGNFHIAAGRGISDLNGMHIHKYDHQILYRFNASHVINKFSIGDERVQRFSPGKITFPLEGQRYHCPPNHLGHVRYYLKIVPVGYFTHTSHGQRAVPNSFEYSARIHHVDMPMSVFGVPQVPGVNFIFDFYPIQVNRYFRRPEITHFLVRLCGIVGGLFVMSGLVDSIISAFWRP
jgi:hypothetical protein